MVVLWDTRMLHLLGMEEGTHTISCLFKNVEDGIECNGRSQGCTALA